MQQQQQTPRVRRRGAIITFSDLEKDSEPELEAEPPPPTTTTICWAKEDEEEEEEEEAPPSLEPSPSYTSSHRQRSSRIHTTAGA